MVIIVPTMLSGKEVGEWSSGGHTMGHQEEEGCCLHGLRDEGVLSLIPNPESCPLYICQTLIQSFKIKYLLKC